MFRRIDTGRTPQHQPLTVELRDVVREYRVGGQSVRALDEISLRLEGGRTQECAGSTKI